MSRFDCEKWLKVEFAKGTRYYQFKLEQDLWCNWVVTRCFGSRQKRGGREMREYYDSYKSGIDRIRSLVEFRQKSRGYTFVITR